MAATADSFLPEFFFLFFAAAVKTSAMVRLVSRDWLVITTD